MNYRKTGKFVAIVALSCALSACAELSDGLQTVSDTLGKVNSGLSNLPTGSAANNKIAIADKVTPQYEVRNLTISLSTVGLDTSATFSGQAYNKTQKLIRITISIPVYDSQGYHAGYVRSIFNVPAKEKIRIHTIDNYALDHSKGEKMNTSKATYQVEVF